MPESRRIRLSKRLIKEALLELMETKPVSKISITALCEQADMNRSTFYTYYNEPYDVLLDIENDVIDQIPIALDLDAVNSDVSYLDTVVAFLDYTKKNEALFRALIVQGNDESFSGRLIQSILEKYQMFSQFEDTPLNRYGFLFTLNGVIGMLKEWIETGFPISSRSLARLAVQMSVQANDIRSDFLENE